MVLVLGWWEVSIGIAMLYKPGIRLTLLLLLLRISGTILAFFMLPDVTFYAFPLVPMPEGQYLIKGLALFFAAKAIGGPFATGTRSFARLAADACWGREQGGDTGAQDDPEIPVGSIRDSSARGAASRKGEGRRV